MPINLIETTNDFSSAISNMYISLIAVCNGEDPTPLPATPPPEPPPKPSPPPDDIGGGGGKGGGDSYEDGYGGRRF